MNAMQDMKPLLNPGYTGHNRRESIDLHHMSVAEKVIIWTWRVIAAVAALVFLLKIGGF